MTPERAKEIIREAHVKVGLDVDGRQWPSYLDEIMSPEERKEVRNVWFAMDLKSAFSDALVKIASGSST